MNALPDDHLPATLNALQPQARAPNAEELPFFQQFEKRFKSLLDSDVITFEGKTLSKIVQSELSRALHHIAPTDTKTNPILNQFSRLLFDGVKGEGAYAKVRGRAPEPGKAIPGKNGPSDLLSRFRYYSRQAGYTGSFGPLRTKGDVRRASRFDERVVSYKKTGTLNDSELALLKDVSRVAAKIEGLSLSNWIDYFNTSYFFVSGFKGNATVGISIWLSSLVLGREAGAFKEHVAPRIGINFAKTISDRRKQDPVNLGDAKFIKHFVEAAELYNYPTSEVSKVLAGEANEEGLFSMTWVYLINNKLYTKDVYTFKKSLCTWYHPFSHKNVKVSTRWSAAEDKFLKIVIKKGLEDGMTTFNAMTLATVMFACRSLDGDGNLVLPVKGAEARPYSHLHARINSRYGYYAIFAKEIGLDFFSSGFFSVTTQSLLTDLGITNDTPLDEMKQILKASVAAKGSMKLDSVDFAPPASTPTASTSGKKKKNPKKRSKKEEEDEEEEEQPPSTKKFKAAKAPAKGRTLASDGGTSTHGARQRKSLD
ncbi:uncharacterized protein JCM6883_004448 [Sporobolomyces salmoneus]|uniref:uncharacterized protein n=1 Tax=Sporobolomyces salmoneus TaxID=183962 RepID=UPI003182214F